MKLFAKRIILSCAFLSTVLACTAIPAQASPAANVKIQVNDDLMQFPDAQPFIDDSNTLQVPLRFVSEKLGYQVGWSMEGNEVKVTLSKDKKKIDLKTGDKQAYINGKPQRMEGGAVFSEGRAYVPLRFIAEAFDSPIQWDERNRIAIVQADSKPHKPAWIAPPPAIKPTIGPSLSNLIIQSANSLIGVPYRWGGSTPQGFDCSGFVGYLFRNKGIELPRTSLQMYTSGGRSVSDLLEGDLVFFANGIVNHVGIYIGNDQFISATSSRGVKVDSLSSTYWGSRYVGAKRVI